MIGRYGSWALVAGASQGLGAAFAEALAEMGFNLVLIARRAEMLRSLAIHLEQSRRISVRCIVADLGTPQALDLTLNETADVNLGLVIYNAAFAPIGAFAERKIEELMKVVDVNIRTPMALIHTMLPRMRLRAAATADGSSAPCRAGFVLMSSLSGNQGSPRIAAYSASKAFTSVLAQGIWHELRNEGVDVTACCAGAIRTPGYADANQGRDAGKEAPGTMDAARVAAVALNALGKKPLVVPGLVNKVARLVMTRILPNTTAVRIMALSTQDLGR